MTNELMKEIEVNFARRFLEIYNKKIGCHFTIDHVGESPDIGCIDEITGERLDLEIAIHQNLDGDVKKEFERIRGERESLGLSMGMRGNIDNILETLKALLEKKLQATYSNTPTALVIGRITTIWSPTDWRVFAPQFLRDIFHGREKNFPKGVWIYWERSATENGEILNLLDNR